MGEAKRRGSFEERQAAAVQARIDFVRQRRLTREAQEQAWHKMKAQAESEFANGLSAETRDKIIESVFSTTADRIIKGR